jgi:hypothetical protein
LLWVLFFFSFFVKQNKLIMARQNKNDSGDEQGRENKNRSQRKGSAFNEKPVPQPAHTYPDTEKDKDQLETNEPPPGIPANKDKEEGGAL